MIKVWTHTISLCLFPSQDGWERRYILETEDVWYCKKYNKYLTTPAGFMSNGADKVADRISMSYFRHDRVVGTPWESGVWMWDDGTPITIAQSSEILKISLEEEAYNSISDIQGLATFVWQKVKSWFKKK